MMGEHDPNAPDSAGLPPVRSPAIGRSGMGRKAAARAPSGSASNAAGERAAAKGDGRSKKPADSPDASDAAGLPRVRNSPKASDLAGLPQVSPDASDAAGLPRVRNPPKASDLAGLPQVQKAWVLLLDCDTLWFQTADLRASLGVGIGSKLNVPGMQFHSAYSRVQARMQHFLLYLGSPASSSITC
jgi:hypothetical protein